jgi:phage replication O-like protein O
VPAAFSYDNLVEFKGRKVMDKSETYDATQNFVKVPHAFYDKLLADIDTLAELKVTAAIIRKTYGFNKTHDIISIRQLMEITGLSSQAVRDGIKAGVERGSILVEKFSKIKHSYSLSFDYSSTPKVENRGRYERTQVGKSLAHLDTVLEFSTPTVLEFSTKVGKSLAQQKKEERNIKESITTKGTPLSKPAQKEVKPGKVTKARDERLDNPSVVAYRDLAKLTPNEAQRALIVEKVKNPAKWQETVKTWLERGYKPMNVAGMVKVYEQGWTLPQQGSYNYVLVPEPPTPDKAQRIKQLEGLRRRGMLTPQLAVELNNLLGVKPDAATI